MLSQKHLKRKSARNFIQCPLRPGHPPEHLQPAGVRVVLAADPFRHFGDHRDTPHQRLHSGSTTPGHNAPAVRQILAQQLCDAAPRVMPHAPWEPCLRADKPISRHSSRRAPDATLRQQDSFSFSSPWLQLNTQPIPSLCTTRWEHPGSVVPVARQGYPSSASQSVAPGRVLGNQNLTISAGDLVNLTHSVPGHEHIPRARVLADPIAHLVSMPLQPQAERLDALRYRVPQIEPGSLQGRQTGMPADVILACS